MTYPLRTIQEDGDAVVILDQTRLPRETAFVVLRGLADAAHAIRSMQVRGAPLIGATAAYGVALAIGGRPGFSDADLDQALSVLAATRPTAINLHWALSRMRRVLQKSAPATRRDAAWNEARTIAREDEAANAAIGRHGLPLLQAIAARKGQVNVMTHCNAGWLATVAHGTALAPIYAAQDAGLDVHVWVSETRPRNQGLLTAWELFQAGVPHTLVADNAAGLLLMQGKVDCVIVGADRIAADGDVANKVGTYLKALAARAHGVPFYVAAPVSTIDFACLDGAHIPIEERAAAELGAGDTVVANPAFDITPASLVSGIITEHGIIAPSNLGSIKP
ncbi:S-methyl-5-thioribose-1-phosphate isomerase [Sulfurisoma sediminicola]|uniref:Methylthioribose-1-phosphate isomerase n=1 Tax=Sulfurisoma sediminicola TaxID=1381557 RepID=A0A497XK53_9PROT|nr:S-methyl-5-thioribose-1-phosphate isomerase [Sulfurisoma sediminicola]RLJ67750.1 methylthioribose-1-phosphate isomerase [Sulfurisoma sediminicola]